MTKTVNSKDIKVLPIWQAGYVGDSLAFISGYDEDVEAGEFVDSELHLNYAVVYADDLAQAELKVEMNDCVFSWHDELVHWSSFKPSI